MANFLSSVVSVHSKGWPREVPRFANHADIIKEGINPGPPNDADYILSQTAYAIDIFNVSAGSDTLTLIQDYIFQFRWAGDDLGSVPGLVFRLMVNGVYIGSTISFNADTGGALRNGEARWIGINLSASEWYTTRRVSVMSTGGGAGKPVPDPEMVYGPG